MSLRSLLASARIPAAGFAVLLALTVIPGCRDSDPFPPENLERLTIRVWSPAFADGTVIPSRFTCDGSDRSPPLQWSSVPEQSRTLALFCDDPDAPGGTWSHWVAFNLSARVNKLDEAVPPDQTIPITSMARSLPASGELDARQGKNDFGKIGYGGPCPPSGTHRYFFRLYARCQARAWTLRHACRRAQGDPRSHPRRRPDHG